MSAVVAFSLFGDDPDDIYYRGAIRNAEMYAELRPDWQLVFYVGKTVPVNVKKDILASHNAIIIHQDGPEDQTATFWRFMTLNDNYDSYLFRDVDSRPYPREIAAVDEWLDSSYDFHVMRDHPRHGAVMLAGLWGVKWGPHIDRMRTRLRRGVKGDYYQVDQDFLKKKFWTIARKSLLAHVDCEWDFQYGEIRDFPHPRNDLDFFAGECRRGDGSLRFPEHRAEVLIRGYLASDARKDVSTPEPAKIHGRRTQAALRGPA